IHPRAG
ncbi:hypothetical protein ANME2D_01814, partial [Candidatus Methanoperedens nitroreducens]